MTGHDAFKPLHIKDREAAKRLVPLLNEAIDRLREIESGTTLIAECPHRFNDVDKDDYWYAAQVGDSFWEQSLFFEHLPTARGRESSRFLENRPADEIRKQGSEFASTKIAAARRVIRHLETAGRRNLVMEAFEPTGQLICLAHQFGQDWLCLADPEEGRGAVYVRAPDDGVFFHVTMCGRIDEAVGFSQPLFFDRIHPEILDHISDDAGLYFRPKVVNRAGYEKFAGLICDAAAQISKITPDRTLICSWKEPYSNYRGFPWTPKVQSEGFNDHIRNIGKSSPNEAQELAGIAVSLEKARWRKGFSEAYEIPCHDGQILAILSHAGETCLIRDHSVFRIGDGEITFLGLCDRPQVAGTSWMPTIISN